MATRNPSLGTRAFERLQSAEAAGGQAMTLRGAILKTALLTLVLMASAGYTWWNFAQRGPAALSLPMVVGGLGGFVVAMLTIFNPSWAPKTAPVYAVLEGLVIGGLSAMYSDASFAYKGLRGYPGMAMEAAALTFGTLGVMLLLYRAGWIRATDRFRSVVLTGLLGIVAYYLIDLVASFFGVHLPMLHSNGWFGIGFSLFVVGFAAASLILDFDAMERAAAARAPAYYEWYTAFGLLVGLVWLYLEILRLLAKLAGRRR